MADKNKFTFPWHISKIGSCESYWTYVLLKKLVDYKGLGSIQDLSTDTGLKVEDVISTLQALDLVKYMVLVFV